MATPAFAAKSVQTVRPPTNVPILFLGDEGAWYKNSGLTDDPNTHVSFYQAYDVPTTPLDEEAPLWNPIPVNTGVDPFPWTLSSFASRRCPPIWEKSDHRIRPDSKSRFVPFIEPAVLRLS